jgi:PIN domain nuclease of toxin-antitoxin system
VSWAYLDTHIAVWMHAGLIGKLTNEARREIDKRDLLISPMVYVEIDYLFQRQRVRYPAPTIFAELSGTFGVTMCQLPFPAIAVAAVSFGWTNDPFDRLIVGHALANQSSRLITSDETIRANYKSAVW